MKTPPNTGLVQAAQSLPADVLRLAKRFTARLDPADSTWWHQSDVPPAGIPVVFNGRGTVKAGVRGWLIHGQARNVFLGAEPNLTEVSVGEFVAVLENGFQALAQLGRDFDFAVAA